MTYPDENQIERAIQQIAESIMKLRKCTARQAREAAEDYMRQSFESPKSDVSDEIKADPPRQV